MNPIQFDLSFKIQVWVDVNLNKPNPNPTFGQVGLAVLGLAQPKS